MHRDGQVLGGEGGEGGEGDSEEPTDDRLARPAPAVGELAEASDG